MKNALLAKEKEKMPKRRLFIAITIAMLYYLVLDLVRLSSIRFILAITRCLV